MPQKEFTKQLSTCCFLNLQLAFDLALFTGVSGMLMRIVVP